MNTSNSRQTLRILAAALVLTLVGSMALTSCDDLTDPSGTNAPTETTGTPDGTGAGDQDENSADTGDGGNVNDSGNAGGESTEAMPTAAAGLLLYAQEKILAANAYDVHFVQEASGREVTYDIAATDLQGDTPRSYSDLVAYMTDPATMEVVESQHVICYAEGDHYYVDTGNDSWQVDVTEAAKASTEYMSYNGHLWVRGFLEGKYTRDMVAGATLDEQNDGSRVVVLTLDNEQAKAVFGGMFAASPTPPALADVTVKLTVSDTGMVRSYIVQFRMLAGSTTTSSSPLVINKMTFNGFDDVTITPPEGYKDFKTITLPKEPSENDSAIPNFPQGGIDPDLGNNGSADNGKDDPTDQDPGKSDPAETVRPSGDPTDPGVSDPLDDTREAAKRLNVAAQNTQRQNAFAATMTHTVDGNTNIIDMQVADQQMGKAVRVYNVGRRTTGAGSANPLTGMECYVEGDWYYIVGDSFENCGKLNMAGQGAENYYHSFNGYYYLKNVVYLDLETEGFITATAEEGMDGQMRLYLAMDSDYATQAFSHLIYSSNPETVARMENVTLDVTISDEGYISSYILNYISVRGEERADIQVAFTIDTAAAEEIVPPADYQQYTERDAGTGLNR